MDIFWNYTILDTPFQDTRADVYISKSVFLSFKPGAECPNTT